LETFVCRGDVANDALKMAGQEIGLFLEARRFILSRSARHMPTSWASSTRWCRRCSAQVDRPSAPDRSVDRSFQHRDDVALYASVSFALSP